MARRHKHRAKLNKIVALLAALLVAFCVLSSLQEKYGMDIGLPSLGLPSLGFLYDYIDELQQPESTDRMDNAMAVSGKAENAPLEVHFLDVGQGKSILVRGPKKNVLIDAGENNRGDEVIRYLESQGVSKLDYAVGTHPHSDHIGGLDTVIEKFPVDSVLLPDLPDEIVPTTQTYTDLLLAIAKKGLKITPTNPGDTYDLGGGVKMTILGPVADYTDLNNMSAVIRVDYKDTSFLFTGDMEENAERDLLEESRNLLKADVLDVGHHGSNTSTTGAFLEAVNPAVAVVSCGLDNSYGHPHREVVERLRERKVQVYRTDLEGAVVVYSDGASLTVSTEK